jgi:hypothetical protein
MNGISDNTLSLNSQKNGFNPIIRSMAITYLKSNLSLNIYQMTYRVAKNIIINSIIINDVKTSYQVSLVKTPHKV